MNPNEVFETKVTRAEMIDMILDDLTCELETQHDKVKKQLDAVEPKAELADFLKLVPKGTEVEVSEAWNDEKVMNVSISFTVKTTALPTDYRLAHAQKKKLEEQKGSLRDQLSQLRKNRQHAKNEIIRKSLEATPEGRQVLSTISEFKVSIKQKLLPESK